MISQGITPPGLKTDVDDTPAEPDAPLNYEMHSQRQKPWENASNSSKPFNFAVEPQTHDDDLPKNIGSLGHSDEDDSEPELSDIELV